VRHTGEEDGSGEQQRKKRAASIMGDYLDAKADFLEGPRFRTPQYVVRKIDGTDTTFFAPAEAAPEPPKPVAVRRSFAKPDGPAPDAPFEPTRKPSAKELIARLRVVKDGVETRREPPVETEPPAAPPRLPLPEHVTVPASAIKQAPVAASAPAMAPANSSRPAPQGPSSRPAPVETRQPETEARIDEEAPEPPSESAQKSEGGKLCPSCGAPIAERNRLFICNGCGKKTCDQCGGYDMAHMKTDVYYEYKFDFPLCVSCYEHDFSIQRLLGKASVCYGNGNYSYALYYINTAAELDKDKKFDRKIQDLINKINIARNDAATRDNEWRIARKHFSMRMPKEDPRWK
jgi:hypothetical protein